MVALVVVLVVLAGAGIAVAVRRGSSSPTTAPAGGPGRRLAWAPPPLKDPVTKRITSQADATLTLDPAKDYRVVLPDHVLDLTTGITITGGHDVVLVGGQVNVTPSSADGRYRRGLYLKGQTGTVHVEGVSFTGDLGEGIDLDEPRAATVELENISISQVTGSYSTNHADLVQAWAGPGKLLVDGLDGTTGYQGFFLLPQQHADVDPTLFDLRNVHITATDKAAYLLWREPTSFPLVLTNVQLSLPTARRPDTYLWPKPSTGDASWRAATVDVGAGTDNAPVAAGVGYRSPGYAS